MTDRVVGAPVHEVSVEEGPFRVYAVVCRAGCVELDPKHPNFGKDWTRAAPGGEEQGLRMALDHLARMGVIPRTFPKVVRLNRNDVMGTVVVPRATEIE